MFLEIKKPKYLVNDYLFQFKIARTSNLVNYMDSIFTAR